MVAVSPQLFGFTHIGFSQGTNPLRKQGQSHPPAWHGLFLHPAWMQGAGLCPQCLSGASPSNHTSAFRKRHFLGHGKQLADSLIHKMTELYFKASRMPSLPLLSPHTLFYFLSGGSFKISLKVTVFVPQPDLFADSLNPVCSLAELSRAQRHQELLNKIQLSQEPERASEIGNNWSPAILAQT